MKSRTRNILIIFLTILSVVGVIAFRQLYWHGTIVITGPIAPYSVSIKKQEYTCSNDRCTIDLFPGKHSLRIKKNGYEDLSIHISLSVWKKTEVFANLEKIPNLFIPKEIPTEKSFLLSSKEEKNETFSHNFLLREDQGTQKLFSGKTLLTSFPNTTGILVASDEVGRGVWGITPNNLYFVDITKRQKMSLLDGDIKNIRTLPNGTAIASQNNQLFLVNPKENSVSPLPDSFLGITAICMPDPQNLFTIEEKEGIYSATLWETDGTQTLLGTLKNFDPQDFMSAECIAPKTILLRFKKDEKTRILSF